LQDVEKTNVANMANIRLGGPEMNERKRGCKAGLKIERDIGRRVFGPSQTHINALTISFDVSKQTHSKNALHNLTKFHYF